MLFLSGGSTDASFVYDADGNRVRGTMNGETTVYIGGIYEYSPIADTLTLSNQTLSGTATYEVENALTAGPSLTVSSGADITFHLFDSMGGARSRCNRTSTLWAMGPFGDILISAQLYTGPF